MATIEGILETFSRVAADPKQVLEEQLSRGKRVVGVGPYYVPEELVYAAGAVPFGVWGAVGTATEAKKYFPPFYCSLCQMSLELGLTHKLDKLSGIMVTGLCDTLKAFSQNWKAGVDSVPMVYVSMPQNRFGEAGRVYAERSYAETARGVEECCGAVIDEEGLDAAIRLYNEWRKEMRTFLKLAGERPKTVSFAAREAVVDAGYFMDKADHLASLRELDALLAEVPASTEGFKRVMLSGIYADIPAVADIVDSSKFAVVADDLAKETRALSIEVAEGTGDGVKALAHAFCAVEADSVLYDPKKVHIERVVEGAKACAAQGVVILLAKFCDPEEFDAPLVRKALEGAGVPVVTVEVDQSTESYEQARTQFETFSDLLA